jgi:hypothetical protein
LPETKTVRGRAVINFLGEPMIEKQEPQMKYGSTVRHVPSGRVGKVIMLPCGRVSRLFSVAFGKAKPGDYVRPEQIDEKELELFAA